MKQDIAEMAGKLTKAQKRAIIEGRATPAMRDLGLAKPFHFGSRHLCLNETGAAIRTHLLAHSHPEKQA